MYENFPIQCLTKKKKKIKKIKLIKKGWLLFHFSGKNKILDFRKEQRN